MCLVSAAKCFRISFPLSKLSVPVVTILLSVVFLKLVCVVPLVNSAESSLVNPVLIEHGEIADKILTWLGLKGALVEDVGEQPEDKTFLGEDDHGDPIVLGSWFHYASYTLAVCMFGTAFLVACIATVIYYVLFVVNDDSNSRKRRSVSFLPSVHHMDNIVHWIHQLTDKYGDNR